MYGYGWILGSGEVTVDVKNIWIFNKGNYINSSKDKLNIEGFSNFISNVTWKTEMAFLIVYLSFKEF